MGSNVESLGLIQPVAALRLWLVDRPGVSPKIAIGNPTPPQRRDLRPGLHVVDLEANLQVTVAKEPGTQTWGVYCAVLGGKKHPVLDVHAIQFEVEQGCMVPGTVRTLSLPVGELARWHVWRQLCGGPLPKRAPARAH